MIQALASGGFNMLAGLSMGDTCCMALWVVLRIQVSTLREVGGLRKEQPGLTCAFSRFAVVLGKRELRARGPKGDPGSCLSALDEGLNWGWGS